MKQKKKHRNCPRLKLFNDINHNPLIAFSFLKFVDCFAGVVHLILCVFTWKQPHQPRRPRTGGILRAGTPPLSRDSPRRKRSASDAQSTGREHEEVAEATRRRQFGRTSVDDKSGLDSRFKCRRDETDDTTYREKKNKQKKH
jgi:hypothetical protein